ncbi:MAG: exodeoxyribonuclease VII large subunit [Calditrichaeota bacterium]|nr:MAG: exodeoxyribonuclease VII large subunit [Calditrichota bacterium]
MNDFEDFLTQNSEECLSVFEATQRIKFILETELPPLQIEGEISNFLHHNSGHMYFSIKDKKAQMPCVMWAGRNSTLRFKPVDGLKVRVEGRVTVYERRGAYQFDVMTMKPAGIGPLQEAFEKLKIQLDAEGLFDESRKKTIPLFPARIGIITSETGAAIRDIISVIQRRWPATELVLRPALVQGETAATDIVAAIDEFNTLGDTDVLIVGRGGGSLEDLWAFNEEIVARAIYNSKIPVVSAVGHQIDYTIADFVADLRAPTPSVAGELVVPESGEIKEQIASLLTRIFRQTESTVFQARQQLTTIVKSYGFRQPFELLKQSRQTVDELQYRIQNLAGIKLEKEKNRVEALAKQLKSLSHQSILNRGFSIVRDEKTEAIIRDSQTLKLEQEINIQFARGTSRAKISDK